MLNKVKEFHVAFGHPIAEKPTKEDIDLRFKLIEEEFVEVVEELATLRLQTTKFATDTAIKLTLSRLAKELADLQYVVQGTAVSFGIPLEEVFNEVHASNMSKLGDDGKPVRREDGKILKGPNYFEPDVKKFFE